LSIHVSHAAALQRHEEILPKDCFTLPGMLDCPFRGKPVIPLLDRRRKLVGENHHAMARQGRFDSAEFVRYVCKDAAHTSDKVAMLAPRTMVGKTQS
jgi:hypothetical protein